MSNFSFKGDTLYRLIPSEGIDLFITPVLGGYNITGLGKTDANWSLQAKMLANFQVHFSQPI